MPMYKLLCLLFIVNHRLETDSVQEEMQRDMDIEDELFELHEEFQYQCGLHQKPDLTIESVRTSLCYYPLCH